MENEITLNKYSVLFNDRKEFKGYTDLVRYLGEKNNKKGNGAYKAQWKEWDRHFEYEHIEGTKYGIRVTNVFHKPLPQAMKRSIYADDIRSLVLYSLAESPEGALRLTNKSRYVRMGLVNDNYSKIEYGDFKTQNDFMTKNNISQRTMDDFFSRNRNNFRGYFDRVYKNLVSDSLIYNPKKLYAIAFEDMEISDKFLSEESIEHSIISDVRQTTLVEVFGVTEYRDIIFNDQKVREFEKVAVREINSKFEKLGLDRIAFFYPYTEIRAIHRDNIKRACIIDNVEEKYMELNLKVVENMRQMVLVENAKAENVAMALELGKIDELKETDPDKYYELNKKYIYEQKQLKLNSGDKSTWVKGLDEGLLPNGHRGKDDIAREYFVLIDELVDKRKKPKEANCHY